MTFIKRDSLILRAIKEDEESDANAIMNGSMSGGNDYDNTSSDSNNTTEDNDPIKQANTFKIRGNIDMMNLAYHNNYNNQNRNYYGPYLPPAMQGIPGNQFNQFAMPVFQGNPQGNPNISSAPTTESHYSFSGGIYNK